MSAITGILVILGIIAAACIMGGCISRMTATTNEPSPYIIECESGGWAIGIDANNHEPIFRAFGYKDAQAALDSYRARRADMFDPHGIGIAMSDTDAKFRWKWDGWISEQGFASPFAARENWNDCRDAILAHDDPQIINHLKL